MKYRVILSDRAEAQLNELFVYVAENSGEIAASSFVEGIINYCRGLDTFPNRGRSRDDLYPGLRCLAYKRTATIAYTVNEKTGAVEIQGVYYGGQDFESDLDTSEN